MMRKQQAMLAGTLSFCVFGWAGLAVAAPAKTGGTITNPFTLTSVPASASTVTVAPSAVVVSASPVAASGISPGKGGGTVVTGPASPPPPSGGPTPPVAPGPATP